MPQDTKTTDSNKLLVFDAKSPGSGDPVYRQSYPSWGAFMNENAVWESNIGASNFNRTYTFSVPSTATGTAIAYFAVDDDAQINIDGVRVITDAQSYKGVKTKQLSIGPGTHVINWTCQNGVGPSGGSGPGGLALLIYVDNAGVPSGINYTVAQLDALAAKFVRGQRIRSAHIEELLGYYNDFLTHTHNLEDITVKDTFGNTAGDQSASVNDATTNPTNAAARPANTAPNTRITAPKHEEIRAALNSLRTHVHSWTDN